MFDFIMDGKVLSATFVENLSVSCLQDIQCQYPVEDSQERDIICSCVPITSWRKPAELNSAILSVVSSDNIHISKVSNLQSAH